MAKILIVEDEPSTAVMLARMLKDAGHTVEAVGDGAAGVAKTKELMPDLVIMDMGLPTMTGWEATRRIKADAAIRHIPVLALTGALTAEDRDEAYNAGCESYQTKPVDKKSLLARVAELIKA